MRNAIAAMVDAVYVFGSPYLVADSGPMAGTVIIPHTCFKNGTKLFRRKKSDTTITLQKRIEEEIVDTEKNQVCVSVVVPASTHASQAHGAHAPTTTPHLHAWALARACLALVLHYARTHACVTRSGLARCVRCAQSKARAAAEAEERKESTRSSFTTPTASPASQRPQRSRAGDVGKPSPQSAAVMGAPPRPKRAGSEAAAASMRAARNTPGDIGHRQQAATGARPPPCASKDVEMAPPPPREPPPATRGERMQAQGAAALMIAAIGAATSGNARAAQPDLMGAAARADEALTSRTYVSPSLAQDCGTRPGAPSRACDDESICHLHRTGSARSALGRG